MRDSVARAGSWSRLFLVLSAWVVLGSSSSTADEAGVVDLADLSLEELMDVEVSLLARKAEPLFEAAAAVAVLSAEDLRRAGVTSIPEALRLVPGMVVGRIDANKWAVSARGFNGRFATKLLVLVDGRTVYSPTFSGVYWEAQDVVFEDVERIEVIRGPGAALWGANAMNGIINIVTRDAAQTEGALVHVGAGTEERGRADVRIGGTAGQVAWRAWTRAFDRDALAGAAGDAAHDDWRMLRGGLRADWAPGSSRWTWLAEAYRGRTGQEYRFVELEPPYERTVLDDSRLSGASLTGRWERDLADGMLAAQVFYDRTARADVLLDETRDTWDVDLQHRRAWGLRHEVVWGLGYRYTTNETEGSFAASFEPSGRGEDVIGGFLQNETRAFGDRLRLVAGSKVEHNDHTGLEWQPSARAWWRLRTGHALWASVSRAVRVPAQADEDVRLNLQVSPPGSIYEGSPVTLGSLFGSRRIRAEKLTAFEAGYRARLAETLGVDVAAFYSRYRDIRSGRVDLPYAEATPPPLHLVAPFTVVNGLRGTSRGLEVAVDWRPIPGRWRLRGTWSHKDTELRAVGMSDGRGEEAPGESPEHQVTLWSSLDLAPAWQVDGILRYVDELPTQDIDAYLVADVRLGWEALRGLEIEVVARNLLDRRHPEFTAFLVNTVPSQTQSEIYAGLRWHVSP